jgi:hypothetical protein
MGIIFPPHIQASICSNILILALRSITRYPVDVVAKTVTQLQNHQMRSLKYARGFFVLYLLTIIVHIDLHRLKRQRLSGKGGLPTANTDPFGATSNPRWKETVFICPEYLTTGVVGVAWLSFLR